MYLVVSVLLLVLVVLLAVLGVLHVLLVVVVVVVVLVTSGGISSSYTNNSPCRHAVVCFQKYTYCCIITTKYQT